MAPPLRTHLRPLREGKGWSQEELARRAGISRAEVSAVETGRAVPSTAVALSLARALGRSVEALFALEGEAEPPAWAWEPGAPGARFWVADVFGRTLRYPVEGSGPAHDGVDALGAAGSRGVRGRPPMFQGEAGPRAAEREPIEAAERTLVLAGCDPAVGLLAEGLRRSGVRLLPLVRSSGRALALLRERRVHVAGVHLGRTRAQNARAARELAGAGLRLVHVSRWSEGVALAPGSGLSDTRAVARARLRWVGRDEGSGARACMDELLEGRRRPEGYDRTASDHRGVVETIRTGWAQAGVCVELAAHEAALDFLPVRTSHYDLCFPAELEGDPRLEALLETLRSRAHRRLLGELPGYDPRDAGVLG